MAASSCGIGRHQSGIGLVEFMISVTLGLFLVTGAVSLYAGTVKNNADLVKTIKFEQELHAVMDLMSGDLRRAGSHGRPTMLAVSANPFGLDPTGAFTGESANSCITFSYDLDQDGALDTAAGDERLGFRLRAGAVEMRRQGLGCDASATPGWERVTDPGRTRITALAFVVNTAQAGPIAVRTVQIAMTGELVDDSSTSRSMVREVRVQNDAYSP